ncbi:MAG: hypothetical protein KAG98_06565 [Lentisphaeria bacterium]|nr:hypothetical protein [Lentisphaeria bacterium]
MKKVVIIDSVDRTRTSLRKIAESRGFVTLEVKTVRQLSEINASNTLLVVIAEELEKYTATEVLHQIQSNSQCARIPIIIYTQEEVEEVPGYKYTPIANLSPKNSYQFIRDILISEKTLTPQDIADANLYKIWLNVLREQYEKQRHNAGDRFPLSKSIMNRWQGSNRIIITPDPELISLELETPVEVHVETTVEIPVEIPVVPTLEPEIIPVEAPVVLKPLTPIVTPSVGRNVVSLNKINFNDDQSSNPSELQAVSSPTTIEGGKIALLAASLALPVNEIVPTYKREVPYAYNYQLVSENIPSLSDEMQVDVLEELVRDGFLLSQLVDKVALCPSCHYHTINIRETCPHCQGIDIDIKPIVHHFSCGFMGIESDFIVPNKVEQVCPKCEKKLRHIGLDYEKPSDTFNCNSCGLIFIESEVELECFQCGNEAPASEVIFKKIYRYTPTHRAVKAVERGTLSEFKVDMTDDSKPHKFYTKDVFDFKFSECYESSKVFGDSLVLSITYFETELKLMEVLRNQASLIVHKRDFAYKKNSNSSYVISYRQDFNKLTELLEGFLHKGIITGEGLFNGTILMREVKGDIDSLTDFVEETYEILMQNKEQTMGKLAIYED